ncbi:MAG TPA: response regulator [Chitinophagaceae bacterium]
MTKIPPKNLVLYADDDPDDLQLVKEAFTQYATNVEVATVNDGLEVISYLKSLSDYDPSPCLVILDINMPRLNGRETLKQLRKMEKYEDVPVILFTTSSLPHDIEFAQKHNAGFISKPLNARQMDVITDQFIDHCAEEIKKQIKRQFK